MLRGFIICPDQELREHLGSVVSDIGHVALLRVFDRYLPAVETSRYVRAYAPDVVFLSVESVLHASAVVEAIHRDKPWVQIVAVHRSCEPQILIEVMRLGIREFLAPPFQRQQVYELLQRLQEAIQKNPPSEDDSDNVFAFLPSKAGVGTTTVAVNTAFALAQKQKSKGLLIDMDLSNGIIRFMLKLNSGHSVIEAAEHALDMDIHLWPQLVTSFDFLDILHSGRPDPDFRIESSQVRHLLDFARRTYSFVAVDLSGNLERYSIEVMQEARRIFLVCTPEIPSLHLAREKMNYLGRLDLSDRVSVILNRVHKKMLVSPEQVADLLGAPVILSLPNDYHGVHRAIQAAEPIPLESELGKRFIELGKIMTERSERKPVAEGSKYLSFFSIFPSRYGEVEKRTAS